MDYKKLLEVVLPRFEYHYGDKIITYLLEYQYIDKRDNWVDVWITINRIPDDIKVTVAKKVLLNNIYSEISTLSKYVPPLSRGINLKLFNSLNNCEEGLDFI